MRGFAGVVVAVLLLGIAPTVRGEDPAPPSPLYTVHAPILIDGDADFTPANGVVSGSGTPGSPFVIEGWEIDATAVTGIEVRNTSQAFEIRSTYVHSGRWPIFGIRFSNVSSARIENTTIDRISGGGAGIERSSDIEIRNSSIRAEYGVVFEATVRATIASNTFLTNSVGEGLVLTDCAFVNATGNQVSEAQWGFHLTRVQNATLQGNTFGPNRVSIDLDRSSNVTILGNDFATDGISLMGDIAPHFASHVITVDNRVDGDPVLFYMDCSDLTVDGVSAGQIIFANCHDVRLTNFTVSGSEGAVLMGLVTDATIDSGDFSSGQGVFGHNVLYLVRAQGIRVYHNNFYGDVGKAYTGVTAFDNGYPSGGNYWSAYRGMDRCSGGAQSHCPDDDGIGDTPHNLSGGRDRYPLMQPFDRNNTPPTPAFTISPGAPARGSPVLFDASASSDGQDDSAGLRVRWDFDGDGSWDTEWLTNKTATHVYPAIGRYTPRLQVRDSGGLRTSAQQPIEVGFAPLDLALIFGPLLILLSVALGALVTRRRRSKQVQAAGPGEDKR